jgi:very-short-patch-repair endonuclease
MLASHSTPVTAPKRRPSTPRRKASKIDRADKRTDLEAALVFALRVAGIPLEQEQFYFARALKRQYRADFAWPEAQLLVECEGGVTPYRDPHTGQLRERGRHLTISGFTADCVKYNLAALLGWRLLRFTPAMVEDGTAVTMIRQALGRQEGAAWAQ